MRLTLRTFIAPAVARGVMAAATVLVLGAAAASAAGLAPPPHPVSVKDSPGYQPLVDLDSASVAAGRMLDAPIVSQPFKNGAISMTDLGRKICAAIHHSRVEDLRALCITDGEFRQILWPEFPQSRPATGLMWDDGWRILYARLHAGTSHAVRDHGGTVCEFVKFETIEPPSKYKNFKLHGGLTMVVRAGDGTIERWKWLRTVAERKGQYKIYSTED